MAGTTEQNTELLDIFGLRDPYSIVSVNPKWMIEHHEEAEQLLREEMSLVGKIINQDYCGSPQPLDIRGQFPTPVGSTVYGPLSNPEPWPQISEETLKQIHEAMEKVEKPEVTPVPAIKFMEDGVKTLKQRAALRDSSGERSMERTVEAFNALTGKGLTTAEGWEFMVLLKMVRGRQGTFHEDDYTDMCGYASLLGEEESSRAERRK